MRILNKIAVGLAFSLCSLLQTTGDFLGSLTDKDCNSSPLIPNIVVAPTAMIRHKGWAEDRNRLL